MKNIKKTWLLRNLFLLVVAYLYIFSQTPNPVTEQYDFNKKGQTKELILRLPFHELPQKTNVELIDDKIVLEGDMVIDPVKSLNWTQQISNLQQNISSSNQNNVGEKTNTNGPLSYDELMRRLDYIKTLQNTNPQTFQYSDSLNLFLQENLSPDDFTNKAISVNRRSALWTNGVIPYVIGSGFSSSKRATIQRAIQHLNAKTNLNLVPRTNHSNYIRLFLGNGCWSYVGRQGGKQDISIGYGCDFGAVVHEICHAAGMYHEQSRSDRNQYVTINWNNITSHQRHNFQQHISDGMDIGSYDYRSIMHYSKYAFSANGLPTIVAKNGQPTGQRNGLSNNDIIAINGLYKSPTNPNPTTIGGFSGVLTAAVNRWTGKSYFFKKGRYIRYNNSSGTRDRGYPKTSSGNWRGSSWSDIDAALSINNGKIYLFKGTQYTRYDLKNSRVDTGYPKSINYGWTGIPWSSIDAAVSRGDSKVYFFKGNQYVRYDFKKMRIDPGYPKTISYGWTGMNWSSIDAAFNYNNKKLYFFKGNQYIRYDLNNGRVDSGYPKIIQGNWSGLM